MNNSTDEPAISASERKDKDVETESPGTPPMRTEDVEKNDTIAAVDPVTEARLLRKLDMRIIPMICWIYLMNFMDRGEVAAFLQEVSADQFSEYW